MNRDGKRHRRLSVGTVPENRGQTRAFAGTGELQAGKPPRLPPQERKGNIMKNADSIMVATDMSDFAAMAENLEHTYQIKCEPMVRFGKATIKIV